MGSIRINTKMKTEFAVRSEKDAKSLREKQYLGCIRLLTSLRHQYKYLVVILQSSRLFSCVGFPLAWKFSMKLIGLKNLPKILGIWRSNFQLNFEHFQGSRKLILVHNQHETYLGRIYSGPRVSLKKYRQICRLDSLLCDHRPDHNYM